MGLIAHYRLDGDAKDAIGLRHSENADQATWVEGKVGKALSDTKISVSDDGGLSFIDRVSLAFWVRRTGEVPHYANHVIEKWNGTGEANFTFYVFNSSQAIRAYATRNGTWGGVSSSYTLPLGEWVHIAWTYDNGGQLYVNGSPHGSRQGSGPLEITSNSLKIGAGMLDIQDVRIYDHVLSPREVRDLSLGLVLHIPGRHDLVDAASGVEPLSQGVSVSPEGLVFDSELSSHMELGQDVLSGWKSATVSLTIKQSLAPVASDDDILFKGPHTSSKPFGFWIDAGTGCYAILFTDSSGNYSNVKYTSTPQGLDEVQVTLTFEAGGYIRAYFDGVEDGNSPWSVSTLEDISSSDSLFVGTNQSLANFLDGTVRGLRIYATALTAAQVKELYQQRASIDSEGAFHAGYLSSIFHDDFSSGLASKVWTTYGEQFGSVSVTDGVCRVVNETGGSEDLIGMYSRVKMNVGGRIVVTSRNPTGRHASVIGFGQPPFHPYPHGRETVGATWYSRADNVTAHISSRGEDGNTLYVSGHNDLREFQEIEVVRDSETSVSYYRDGVHQSTITTNLSKPHYLYFTADGHTKPCSIEIKEVYAEGVNFSCYEDCASAPGPSEAGVTRGIAAWYPLIGDTLDYAGTNHAVNNGATATAEGYEFDGVDDYAATADPFTLGADSFTVSLVSRLPSVSGAHTERWISTRGSSNDGVEVVPRNGVVSVLLGDDAGNYFHTDIGTTQLQDGALYVVSVVVDRSIDVVEVYLNGVLDGSLDFSVQGMGSVDTGRPLHLGRAAYSSTDYLPGTIRDVRIHNVALTPEEVAIQAKLTLDNTNRTAFAANCMYTRGQIKEVIA